MRRLPSARRAPRSHHRHTLNKALLYVEMLESRLAPAVIGVDATANVHAIDPNIYGTAFATAAQLSDLNIPLNRNGGNASDTYSYAAGRDQPRQRLVLREHCVRQRATGREWIVGSTIREPAVRSRASRSTSSTGPPRSRAIAQFSAASRSPLRPATIDRPVVAELGQRRSHQRHQRHRQRSESCLCRQQPRDRADLDSAPHQHVWQLAERRREVLHARQRAGPVELDASRHPPERRHADRAPRSRDRLRVDGQVARSERQHPRVRGMGLDELLHQRRRRGGAELGRDL